MLDPTADEAYQWPDIEPVAFDGFGAPIYDHALPPVAPFPEIDLEPYVGFVQRFIVGMASDADVDPLLLRPGVLWQIPEPMTIQARNVDPELLEILYGQAVVPLCSRQIPTKGTE